MHDNDKLGTFVLLSLAAVSIPYLVVRHPVKTYRLLVHGVGWYDLG